MKSLYLLRHAKSSWDQSGLADKDRGLSRRGIRACALLGDYLRENRMAPDFIWCSTARRARETLEHIFARAGWQAAQTAITYTDDLYLATAGEIAAHLRLTDDTAKAVMLVGHNPGIEDLARALIRDDPGGSRATLERKYPTGGLALFTFAGTGWRSLADRSCTLRGFITPRQLEAGAEKSA